MGVDHQMYQAATQLEAGENQGLLQEQQMQMDGTGMLSPEQMAIKGGDQQKWMSKDALKQQKENYTKKLDTKWDASFFRPAFAELCGCAMYGLLTGGCGFIAGMAPDPAPFMMVTCGGMAVALFMSYFACGHYTGGHLNPMISLACALGGACEMWRGLLYIPFQLAGFICGSWGWKIVIGPKLGRNEEMSGVDRDETRWVERPYMTKFTHQTFGGMRLGMWSIHPTGMRYPGEEESGSSHRGETYVAAPSSYSEYGQHSDSRPSMMRARAQSVPMSAAPSNDAGEPTPIFGWAGISLGSGLVMEMMACWILLFVVCSLVYTQGKPNTNAVRYGHLAKCIIQALIPALLTALSIILALTDVVHQHDLSGALGRGSGLERQYGLNYPGWTGAGMNPGKFLGPMTASFDFGFNDMMVFLITPFVAALTYAPVHLFAIKPVLDSYVNKGEKEAKKGEHLEALA